MSKTKIIVITGLFFLLLTSIRVIWNHTLGPLNHPPAVQGVIDLRAWDFASDRTLTLSGEWEFYPNELLMQHAADLPLLEAKKSFVQVPGDWRHAFGPDNNSPKGYGSYRLRILVDPGSVQAFSIQIKGILTSSEVFVNGSPLAGSGKPAVRPGEYTAANIPYAGSFTTDKSEIDVVIHTANFVNGRSGGISNTVKFGSERAISREGRFSMGMQLVVCAILLMHAVYACILYWAGTRQKTVIYFALTLACTALAILVDDDKLLVAWVPINYAWSQKLLSLSYTGAGAYMLQFFRHHLREGLETKVFLPFFWLCIFYSLCTLLPIDLNIYVMSFTFLIIFLFPFFAVPVLAWRTALRGDPDTIFLLLSATSLTTNVIWGMLKNTVWFDLGYYPVDMVISFFCVRFVLGQTIFKNCRSNQAAFEETSNGRPSERRLFGQYIA